MEIVDAALLALHVTRLVVVKGPSIEACVGFAMREKWNELPHSLMC
jgi:hypothetical protein